MTSKNNKQNYLIIIFIILFLIILALFFLILNLNNQKNTTNYVPVTGERTLFIRSYQKEGGAKACLVNDDCELSKCGGCFSKEFLSQDLPELPCSKFEGYSCACQKNQCTEIRK